MRPAAADVLRAAFLCSLTSVNAAAQFEPPRIGPFVVDLRGTVPNFPDGILLANSRGLNARELPGLGLGVDAGAHVYIFKLKAITFGLGGQLTFARGRFTPPEAARASFRSVTERFVSFAPQLSFNFGTGRGWSYFSGGVGRALWSVVPDGAASGPADEEQLLVFNYGGGARWFAKTHLAFTFDVRIYAIDLGTPFLGRPGSPRTTMLVLGAGISVK